MITIQYILVHNIEEELSSSNVVKIKSMTDGEFDHIPNEGITYSMLINSRTSGRGYPVKLNGIEKWVLPINAAWELEVDPNDSEVVELFSEKEFKEIKFDIEETEE